MNLIKNLLSAASGGIYGYLAAVIFGAVLSGGAVYYLQDLRIAAADARNEATEARLDTAENEKAVLTADLENCREATERQNKAVDAMEARAKEAEQAMGKADAARQTAEQRAADILRQRTPDGADKCEAARKAFADELKQERGL